MAARLSRQALGIEAMFRQVIVWLEYKSPDIATFVHALYWAERLHLPLHCIPIAGSRLDAGSKPAFEHRLPPFPSWPPLRLANSSRTWRLDDCAESCRLNGVEWIIRDRLGVTSVAQSFNVIGRALPGGVRQELLERVLRDDRAGALVCSSDWTPMQRVLLLNDARHSNPSFVRHCAGLCCLFRASLSVLTFATTETEAQCSQQAVKNLLAAEGQLAQFDYAAGCDLATIVRVEALCRRCSHVFLDRETAGQRSPGRRASAARPFAAQNAALNFAMIPAPAARTGIGANDRIDQIDFLTAR
jgi:hypothetical protein